LGTYIGGQLLGIGYLHPNGQLYNYVTVFTTSIIGLIIAFFWVLFVINEKESDYNENSRVINSNGEKFKSYVEKREEQTQQISSDEKLRMFRVFDFDNVKEVLRTCFKSRPNKGRAQIWLLYLSMCTFMISDVKNSPVLFPYVEQVFHWDAQQFSTIKSIASIASIISYAVIVPALSGLFKVNDTKLGIIGVTAMFFASIALGSLVSPTGIYLCYAFNAATGSFSIAIRSLLSKIVSETEIGKVYSLLAAIETVVPSINSIFYNTIFQYTIDFYPSLCFQVAAVLLFYPLIVFIWIDMTRMQFY
jgi:PCFT/HCP family folate transporter-like MFS transporter 1/3